MDRPASIPLKVVYGLAVLAMALMVGLSSSGWVQMGMRASPATLLLALPPLLLMVFAFHRVYQVVRWPRTSTRRRFPASGRSPARSVSVWST